MSSFTKTYRRAQVVSSLLIGGFAVIGLASQAIGDSAKGPEHPVYATALPNVPGKALTAVVVTYAPGGKSPVHHHAGSVFAYGPVKVYQAGEAFFEPPGSAHLISENASTSEPASLLAVFVADDGAKLTSLGQ